MNLPAGSRSPRPTNQWYNQVTEATRAYNRNKQRQGTGTTAEGRLSEFALPVRIKNNHATPIPTYGLTRWGGDPIKAASLTDGIPDLILRTSASDTTDSIGVAVDYIKNGNFGAVQTLGVCWARVYGAFDAGDFLEPDSSFRGILDTSGASNVTALADGPGAETEGIIPVFIGNTTTECTRSYDLRMLWLPASGTVSIGVRYNSVTESIAWNHDDTHEDVIDLINAHSEFVAASVSAGYVGAGSFPSSNMVVRLPSGATIVSSSSSLIGTGGNPVPEFRVDLCGCS